MNNAIALELERLQAKFPGYEFSAILKPNATLLSPKQVVDNIVNKLKANYPNVTISLAPKTFNAFAVVVVESKSGTDDLAYYVSDDIGYEGESIYYDITTDIKNDIDLKNAGMKVLDFIDGKRICTFEIYI